MAGEGVMGADPAYDTIGRSYAPVRRPEPRIAAAIQGAPGDARTVVNVGAGAGSYEPTDRWVLAVEPSRVMIAQRPAGAAPVIEGVAEALPLADATVDAAMAVLTLQHWRDVELGLKELLRVVRQRIVIVTMDVDQLAGMWLWRDYIPEVLDHHAARFPTIARLCELLPACTVEPLPVPRGCVDGFAAAFWDRPEALFDESVRAASSVWHDLAPGVVDRALDRLRVDLASGEWQRRNRELSDLEELDVGLRLINAEKSMADAP